jgi:hypothetical protein
MNAPAALESNTRDKRFAIGAIEAQSASIARESGHRPWLEKHAALFLRKPCDRILVLDFQMDKMQKDLRSARAICAIAVGVILVTGSAYGNGLLDEDSVYLKTAQQLERYDAPILDLSPEERSHLHDLINNPRSIDDLYARYKNVKDALALFLSHQLWEKANQGQMWDAPGSKYPQWER